MRNISPKQSDRKTDNVSSGISNYEPMLDPQLLNYFNIDENNQEMKGKGCIIRRNVQNELDGISPNMVEIIKILNN